MKKGHGSLGSMAKGKGGTGRTVDHCSMGKKLSTPRNFNENPISYAAGKAHGGVEGGKPKSNPKLKPKVLAKGPQKVG